MIREQVWDAELIGIAEHPLSVQRKDGVQGPVRPGEDVVLTVLSTDPQGHPVPAEVSLAMVQQSLLQRFAWPMPTIQDFFRGEPRTP